MKNRNQITGLLRAAVLCLIVSTIAACNADDFTRNAGQIPSEEDMTKLGGVLRRDKTPDQISILKLPHGESTTDAVFYQLTHPAPAAVTITVDVDDDQALLDEYNKDKAEEAKLKLFPLDKVSFAGGKTLTIAKGAKSSGMLDITLSREGIDKGMYLLPLRAILGEGVLNSSTPGQIIFYRVVVAELVPESALDTYSFKAVGYLDTEEMNPLYGNYWLTYCYDMLNDIETIKTWLDIEALRRATIKYNATSQRAILELGVDLQYVLYNRDKYIVPLQKASKKVLICIQGGNTGLGFCNMTDAQITDFVFQLKYVIDLYQLDGVNFFDMEAGYSKEGVPAIVPASYPKLIKATREALGQDRLITIACDVESTELLATAQEGIEAGAYIDYAWSAIFDKVVDAYAEGSELKPIAGLDRAKWGSAMLRTHDVTWMREHKAKLILALKELYFKNSESANVFAFYDMTARQQGTERGVAEAYATLFEAMEDGDLEYDGMLYDAQSPPGGWAYGDFSKDW